LIPIRRMKKTRAEDTMTRDVLLLYYHRLFIQ
jgi:hypothetical protein